MKRLISISAFLLAALLLLTCMTACGKKSSNKKETTAPTEAVTEKPTEEPTEEETEAITLEGTYKMVEVTGSGDGVDSFNNMKDDIILEISEYGNAVMKNTSNDKEIELDFDESSETVVMNGSTYDYTFDGTTLSIGDDASKMIFKKTSLLAM